MPELGNKYECFSCGSKFYDLGRADPICPKCGANQKDAKKQEPAAESAAAKKRRREEVVRLPEEAEEDTLIPPAADDDFVDEVNEQLFRELLSFMLEDTRTITRAIRLTFVAKSLERIADHATNIAELVVYMVEGKNIRHVAPTASF